MGCAVCLSYIFGDTCLKIIFFFFFFFFFFFVIFSALNVKYFNFRVHTTRLIKVSALEANSPKPSTIAKTPLMFLL